MPRADFAPRLDPDLITAWLRARHAEADAGMPPGIGLTGMAVLRPQADPRLTMLVHDEDGGPEGGPTIVLLHGLGASSAFGRPVAAELAGSARTLVPDLLGFAGSIRLGTHFHLDDQAAAVVRLVERPRGSRPTSPPTSPGRSCPSGPRDRRRRDGAA